jgi:hypothetical protein
VHRDVCEVCDARFTAEWEGLSDPDGPSPRMLHPSVPLRFADVIEELREIADLASAAVEVEGAKLARACRRAEALLRVLRAQFLQDVVHSEPRAKAM